MYSSKQIIRQNYLGTGLIPIPMSSLNDFQSKIYYYEIWIYVNSVDAAAAMNLTAARNPTYVASTNPKGNIFYIDNTISLDLYKNTSLNVNVYNVNKYDSYEITPTLPLQKWQHIIISVQNYLMDFYLNGKLLKSINLSANNGVPVPTKTAKINFGGSDAYIAKFNRSSTKITTNEAWKRYLDGNSGIIPMKASLTLTTDPTRTTKHINLF
jgi:hypothetical protein